MLPGNGRAEWLQQVWAQFSGIASRSDIFPVRSLVEQAATGDGERKAFDRDALTLAIAGAAQRHGDKLAQLPDQLRSEGPITGGRLAWARQLADALDVAYLCRQPSERYTTNNFLESLSEIPEVSAQLKRHIGHFDEGSFAEAANAWIRALERRKALPHVWIQMDLGLPTLLMERLLQLLQCLPASHVHCYILAPSLQYWEDLRVGRRRVDDDAERDPGPILRSCGRRAQDLQAQLIAGLLKKGWARGNSKFRNPLLPYWLNYKQAVVN